MYLHFRHVVSPILPFPTLYSYSKPTKPTQRTNPHNILSTPLYAQESTVDFTSRLARLLAKKLQLPVYVGNSISFAGAGMGGSVEEEMAGFKACVEVVLEQITRIRDQNPQNQQQQES